MTTTATPERSLEQRLEALNRANDVRTARARLKKDLKAGRRSIDSLLVHPPDFILTMKLFDLLLHVPKWGRVKVTKALKETRISPSKTIGGMSERQRFELLRLMRQADAERESESEKRRRACERDSQRAERQRAYQREYRRP